MDRLVNFLQDDLKEIDESFEHIKDYYGGQTSLFYY